MGAKNITKEEKLAQIEEARRCYEEAQELIDKGDALIRTCMRGVEICGHDACKTNQYNYKGMIEVHLYSGIGKLEKLFETKAEPYVNICGEKERDRKALCVGGIEFFQIGHATQSKFCYK